MKTHVLIVEDEAIQRQVLATHLQDEGYDVLESENVEQALERIRQDAVDIVISDFKLPDGTGQDLLEKIQEINPAIPVILITAYASVEKAVQAMKSGAFDYITKPIQIEELLVVLKRAREHHFLLIENQRLKAQLEQEASFSGLIGKSRKMQEVLNLAARVAPTQATVLLRGESGTGKEMLARAIHLASPRRDGPFVAFNVAALPATLIESELFGHEKGAFTGADRRRLGRFEEAHGGTIFIDEIGDMPLEIQTRLLRVLQENTIQRLGSNKNIPVDIRIIAATHKNLEQMIKEGTFREDLYYRLNVISIHIPPLRKRKDDIPLMAQHFLEKYRAMHHKEVSGFTREAFDKLMKYNYPGNVRELENIIERAVILARGNAIDEDDLPEHLLKENNENLREVEENLPLDEAVARLEMQLIRRSLEKHHGNQTRAAEELGISERKLRYKMEKYGLK